MNRMTILTLALVASIMSTVAQNAQDFRQPYALGQKLEAGEHFTGDVWLAPLSTLDSLHLPAANVTFAPCCINSWHYHTGGQILIASAGVGYYQEQGQPARRLFPGDIVEVAPGTVHWHGAAPDSWFAHVALKPNVSSNRTVWLEPVGQEAYTAAVAQSMKTVTRLTARQQAIVAIGAYTGRGDLHHLAQALTQALEAGLTVNEIKEILIQAYAYCGFPRSLRALQTFMQVLDERKAQGINDTLGREASYADHTGDKYARGAAMLKILSGIDSSHPKTGYGAFAPTIDTFLKEHLFADIFERDLLSYQERELATVSFLSGVGGVEPMARGHMGICLHLGISKEQLSDLLNIVENALGAQATRSMRSLLESMSPRANQ